MTPIEAAAIAAERSQGSCQSISDLGSEFEALQDNSAFCAELDQLVFCCSQCNWWFEQSDMAENDDWICEDCGS